MPTPSQFNNNISKLNKLPKSTNHLQSVLLSETELQNTDLKKLSSRFNKTILEVSC
jgi:hypothetical protein